MAKKQSDVGNLIGSWAFLVGVLLAIILGLIGPIEQWMGLVLVIIGVIVGLLNITAKESMGFLTAATVLVIVTTLPSVAGDASVFAQVGLESIQNILDALMLVFVPATIIVALRAVFGLARG